MLQQPDIDGVLIQWGDRLFYPGNRIVKNTPARLGRLAARARAAVIRDHIEATVVRRAPQVMVKVTGGGRGMKAIAAHLRYISKNGRLEIEDELEQKQCGKDALRSLADDWRFGGTLIDDIGDRREAYNIMLSMPRGIDPASVQWAAREFAKAELADHKYVMVLHDHQANPHVHISVRAESKHGKRLNPRKADLHRWRETFAGKLQELGIDAAATRQQTRGVARRYPALWQVKAADDGRLLKPVRAGDGSRASPGHAAAVEAWQAISAALERSTDASDRKLAESINRFAGDGTRRRLDMPRVQPDVATPARANAPERSR